LNEIEIEKIKVLDLLNLKREEAGLSTLCLNTDLESIAQEHSNDMQSCNQLSHTGCNGETLIDRINNVGYDYRYVGENIAWNQKNALDVVADWMNSPNHRANILNPQFNNIGIGLSNKWYWTTVFGTPLRSDGCTGTIRSIPNNMEYYQDPKVSLKNYCKCKDPYFNLGTNLNQLCQYKRKSRKTALILQCVIFPFGAGSFYLGWDGLGIMTLLSFIIGLILVLINIYSKTLWSVLSKYISIFFFTLWVVFWIVGLIYIIINPIDENGVPAV
jgi:hypothetical protein